MTQAEFARSAGWSASTISGWERGTAKPSRLAFKTILAFAEERGVRYQPKGEGRAPAAVPGSSAGSSLPVLRLSSRLAPSATLVAAPPSRPVPPPGMLLDAERPSSPLGREESYGSRRWTEIATHGGTPEYATRAPALAERKEWQVEARVQLRIGSSADRLSQIGYVAASLIALAIGLGTGVILRRGNPSIVPATVNNMRAGPAMVPAEPIVAGAPEFAPPVQVDELALAARTAPVVTGPPLAVEPPSAVAAAVIPVAAVPAMPAPSLARLESIVALDGVRRASFRVGDRSIALVEGDQIGGRVVVTIANDTVTLSGAGRGPQRVRLGSETPIE